MKTLEDKPQENCKICGEDCEKIDEEIIENEKIREASSQRKKLGRL